MFMYYIQFEKKNTSNKLQHMLFSKTDVCVNQKLHDFLWLKPWLANNVFFNGRKEAKEFLQRILKKSKKQLCFLLIK